MRSCAHLQRIASGLMLLGMVAFVQQGAMIAASQALASIGSMPDPAVAVRGLVHYHNDLAGHVHVHGRSVAGHIHKTADVDHQDTDEAHTRVWSLGCASAVIPMMPVCIASFVAVSAEESAHVHLKGVAPAGLNRPPSTPSIA